MDMASVDGCQTKWPTSLLTISMHSLFALHSSQSPWSTVKSLLLTLLIERIKIREFLKDGLTRASGNAAIHRSLSFWPWRFMKKTPHLNWFRRARHLFFLYSRGQNFFSSISDSRFCREPWSALIPTERASNTINALIVTGGYKVTEVSNLLL